MFTGLDLVCRGNDRRLNLIRLSVLLEPDNNETIQWASVMKIELGFELMFQLLAKGISGKEN
jgi:hypothetical protein